MADVFSKEKRSDVMSKIRSVNTKPELTIRRFLFSQGFRYKLHQKDLPGKPDIVLKKYHTVIFVNGCFWHGHSNCSYFRLPKTRTEWWQEKIERNIKNDLRHQEELRQLGYKVIVLWECGVKNKSIYINLIKNIRD